MKISERIEQLLAEKGTLRAVSRGTGIDIAYLHRLHAGEKWQPSEAVLDRLGLVRVIDYQLKEQPHA
jgi:hypothetical protein